METAEHTFPLPEAEVHKLDVAQHELEDFAEPSTTSPVTQFFQENKWSLVIFGALGIAVGLAMRRK